MCASDLPKVTLDSAAAGIEPTISKSRDQHANCCTTDLWTRAAEKFECFARNSLQYTALGTFAHLLQCLGWLSLPPSKGP